MRIAVVRVRGTPKIAKKVEDTMKMLNIEKVNHCSLITDNPQYKGMLQKVKDYTTWGEIKEDEVVKLLHKRGRLKGGKRLTDEYVKENTKFKDIDSFAKALYEGKTRLKEIPGIKPYFRLNPPKGGYGHIKKQYPNKGTLGNRGTAMSKLLDRMLR